MKIPLNIIALFAALLLLCQTATAQIETPRPSPLATVTQMVGLTEFTITYSRPGVKDREIFGSLVPYGQVWRTGANASTRMTFEDDVMIGGNKVPAGMYALYSIPGEKEWTIMIYKDLDLGGAVGDYDKTKELVRFTVKPRALNDKVESLTIDWSGFTSSGATLTMSWENTAIDIPVAVNTDDQVMAAINDQLIEPKGPDARTYAAAATYYHENGKDLEMALKWMNKAVEMRPEAFWYIHRKAKILKDLGRKKEAIAAAEKSMELAKANEGGDYGYVKNNTDLLEALKKMK